MISNLYTIEVTFEINGEEKTEGHNIIAHSRSEAFAKALKYATGYGAEDYYRWDDPEILSRNILKIELIGE